MAKMNCPICHGEVEQFYKSSDGTTLKCKKCGFGFAIGFTKNKAAKDINNIFYHRDSIYIKEQKLFQNIYQRRINMIGKIKQAGKALEIGSSTGLMLFLLQKKGWQVQGIEPSLQAAEFANKLGIPTKLQFFENSQLKKESYDLVIINHTLEHLENPLLVLNKIHNLLRNDGALMIDVPNFGSLSAKIYGSNWPYLLPDEHRSQFTLQSLNTLLIKANFSVVDSNMYSGIWDFANPYLELWQALFGFKKRFFNELITALPCLIISKLNMGTSLTILAKKNI